MPGGEHRNQLNRIIRSTSFILAPLTTDLNKRERKRKHQRKETTQSNRFPLKINIELQKKSSYSLVLFHHHQPDRSFPLRNEIISALIYTLISVSLSRLVFSDYNIFTPLNMIMFLYSSFIIFCPFHVNHFDCCSRRTFSSAA